MRHAMRCIGTIRCIITVAFLGAPAKTAAQGNGEFPLAGTGSFPWTSYQSSLGFLTTWYNLNDAVHLRRIDTSGSPTNDTLSLLNTYASLFPRICSNAHHSAIVWNDRVSNTIAWPTTYIKGYLFNRDSLRSGIYVEFNNDYRDALRGQPDVQYLDDTLIVIAWAGSGPSTITPQLGIYAQLMSTSGRKIGDNVLLCDHIENGADSFQPRILSHEGDGRFIVTWVDNSSGNNKLYGRKFDSNGIAHSGSFLISDDSAMTNMYYYSVARDSSGNFVAIWIADRDWVSRIEWRWYDPDAAPITGVEALTEDGQLFNSGSSIDISIDTDGKIVTVWEQRSGRSWKIFGQRYLSNRTPLGGVFRISEDTSAANELFPRVLLKEKKIFTVWQAGGINASIMDFDCVGSVNDSGSQTRAPLGGTLLPCYPNPFNSSTIITFRLDISSQAKLEIYNLLGEELRTLVDQFCHPGTYRTVWDALNRRRESVSSGVYIVRLTVGGHSFAQKVYLLR